MLKIRICKRIFAFIWMSAIVAGIMTWLLFTLVDPAELAVALRLEVDPGEFRIRCYGYAFLFIWLLYNSMAMLNCYYMALLRDRMCGKEEDVVDKNADL